LTRSENTEAREAGAFRIQEILRHPDDLVNKFNLVRKKVIAERALIDAQLRTAVESQLDDCELGIKSLENSQELTKQVKSNLSSIDSLWDGTSNTIANYARIKRVRKN
jgi:exocyst complex component 3